MKADEMLKEFESEFQKITTSSNELVWKVAKKSALWAFTRGREAAKAEIFSLIQDDAYACTFQTMGQYRSALCRAVSRREGKE